MNQNDLTAIISRQAWRFPPVTRTQRIIGLVFEEITKALADGETVTIRGFGTFKPKERAPRTGRNPHTDTPVPIPRRVVPVFEPAKALKEATIKEVVR